MATLLVVYSGLFALFYLYMEKHKSWFKLKQYPHIGMPIPYEKKKQVIWFIKNKKNIAHYSFCPLIRREQNTYRYKLQDDGIRRKRTKVRLISFASHLDSLIYSFYSFKLSKVYEHYLQENNLVENVIAYRSIPKSDKGNKCNIDFAKDIFDEITVLSETRAISVVVSDISSFFDNIDHVLLKKAWKSICKKQTLEPDEYNVFKSVTKYSYVRESDLFALFGKKILCKSKDGRSLVEKNCKKLSYMRNLRAVSFCTKQQISLLRSKGYLRSNKTESKGIPQGLPISALLANMYMYEFDLHMSQYILSVGGVYRRYSDDLIMVVPLEKKEECRAKFLEEIKNVKLEISEDKTKDYTIVKDSAISRKVLCQDCPAAIEYLGFSFDGRRILIKNKGVSNYYLKMHKNVSRRIFWALNINNGTYGNIFENQLLKRYTPIGSKCHKIYVRNPDSRKFHYSGKKSFGNYWTYVKKSAEICGSDSILHQMRNNKRILKEEIIKAKEIISLGSRLKPYSVK